MLILVREHFVLHLANLVEDRLGLGALGGFLWLLDLGNGLYLLDSLFLGLNLCLFLHLNSRLSGICICLRRLALLWLDNVNLDSVLFHVTFGVHWSLFSCGKLLLFSGRRLGMVNLLIIFTLGELRRCSCLLLVLGGCFICRLLLGL